MTNNYTWSWNKTIIIKPIISNEILTLKHMEIIFKQPYTGSEVWSKSANLIGDDAKLSDRPSFIAVHAYYALIRLN